MRKRRYTTLLVTVVLAVMAPFGALAQPTSGEITIGEHEGQGALFRAGQLYAAPLADPRDFVLLEDDTVLLVDAAVGVVGVGGRFGADPEQPGLAARVVLVPNLPQPHRIVLGPVGEVYVLTLGDGGLLEVLPFEGQATPIATGLDDPQDLEILTDGFLVTEGDGSEVFVGDDGGALPLDDVGDARGIADGPGGVHVCDFANDVVLIAGDDGTFVPVAEVPSPTVLLAAPVDADAADAEVVFVISDPNATAGDQPLDGDETVFVLIDEAEGVTGDYEAREATGIDPRDVLEHPERFDAEAIADLLERLAGGGAPGPATTDGTADPGAGDDVGAGEVPAPSGGTDGINPWLLIFLIVFGPMVLLTIIMIAQARRQARAAQQQVGDDAAAPPPPVPPAAGSRPDPHGGSVDMVPKDPCEELRKAADAAEAACDDATAGADAAEKDAGEKKKAAADAAKAAKAAAKRAKAAAKELAEAGEVPEEGDWAEDDRGRITQRDLGLRRAASKAAYKRYQDGEISAAELEAEWEELGDRDAIDKLREQAEAQRAERLAAAEAEKAAADQAKADAEAEAESTKADADAAAEAAEQARAEADGACADARAKRAAADECEEKMRAEYARQEAARKAEAEARLEELEKEEQEPIVHLDENFEPVGRGSEPGERMCCPCGVWIIYGSMVAGMSIFAGWETTKIWAKCACSDKWVEMVCETLRLGLGLGGEGGPVVGVAFGTHASDLPAAVAGSLNGVNWDVSVGVSAGKAAKTAGSGGDILGALKALKEVAKKGVKPGDLGGADAMKVKAAGELVQNLTKSTGKQSVRQGVQQTDGVGALIVPATPFLPTALQVGLWTGIKTKVYVTDSNTCDNCVVPGYGMY